MARFLIGVLALAAAIAAPTSLWAEDEVSDSEIGRSFVATLREKLDGGELKQGVQIVVRVDEGTVWIEGNVTTQEQQRMLLDIARRILGVRLVVNQLKVTSPKSPSRPAKMSQPSVARASANMPAPANPESAWSAWRSQAKQVADLTVQSIKSKQEAGKLKGFDVIVYVLFGRTVHPHGNTIHLHGKVANKQTRDTLLNTLRGQLGVSVSDFTEIAKEGTDLPDKVTSRAAWKMDATHPRQLNWDADWWQLNFKSK